MRTIVNWNPAAEFRALEHMFDRLFDAPVAPNGNTAMTMPVDIVERDNALQIRASVPGIDPNDLEVSIDNRVLTIRGETKAETESGDSKVYRREIRYGQVSRSIRLPEGLNLEAVDAEFKNGFVTVTLPRIVESKPEPQRITVRTSGDAPTAEGN
jgi:HSP20 family protein